MEMEEIFAFTYLCNSRQSQGILRGNSLVSYVPRNDIHHCQSNQVNAIKDNFSFENSFFNCKSNSWHGVMININITCS